MTWTAADIRYDPVAHVSTSPDGRVVPHVTGILKAVGVTEDFEALADRSSRIAANIEFARARGTAVHADCHAWDDGDLDLGDVDERIRPWVDAWIETCRLMQLEPLERERFLYHPIYNYAGIMDGIFRVAARDIHVLLDIKTGDPEDAAGHLQTAGYEGAYRASGGTLPIHERWAVQLTPDRTIPYRVTNYSARPDAHLDEQRFYAAVVTFNEQPQRRRAA